VKSWLRLFGLAVAAILGACSSSRTESSRRAAASCGPARQGVWLVDPSLCLSDYSTDVRGPGGRAEPRGLAFAPNGDLFVVSSGHVLVLFDANGDLISDSSERSLFASNAGLNHGIAFDPDANYLYASTPNAVYRWSYSPGRRTAADAPTLVVGGMASGGHATRTLRFDRAGKLYVSIGSASNLDTDPTDLATRSQIRRFTIPAQVPPGGIDFTSGEVVANGMRNEVGITFDDAGRFWGVENGRDSLEDPRFGGDIHLDNPAEKLNRIDGPGPTYFGYPQCWSEGSLPGGAGAGTHHADQQLQPPLLTTDGWCQSVANVRPPAFTMPAHWAPLGIVQYTGSLLPAAWRGDLFITSHGSWNRETGQVGRLIARAHVASNGAIASLEPVLGERSSSGGLAQGYWSVRPADIQQGPDGALYFSDDNSGRVLRLGAVATVGDDAGQPGSDGGVSATGQSSGCSSATTNSPQALIGLFAVWALGSARRMRTGALARRRDTSRHFPSSR